MSAVVTRFPSIEVALVTELTTEFGSGYRFCSIFPEDVGKLVDAGKIVTRIKRISGAARNVHTDRPIVDLDTASGDYGTSDLASRDIEAAMLSLRGKKLYIGVVQHVSIIAGSRWLVDPAPQFFRFSLTVECLFHR
jgi:hypothetical protein